MKILVFSDTHGKTDKMYDIISKAKMTTDLVIHLGDNYKDVESIRDMFPECAFLGVCGNCDYTRDDRYPQSSHITLDGHTFFFTHGHMQSVKTHGFSLLIAQAKNAGASTALFGHTHKGLIKEENGITLFNPGSLSQARDYSGGSYGVITVKDGKCKYEIIKI